MAHTATPRLAFVNCAYDGSEGTPLVPRVQSVLGASVHFLYAHPKATPLQWAPDGGALAAVSEEEAGNGVAIFDCKTARASSHTRVPFRMHEDTLRWGPCACHLLALPAGADTGEGLLLDRRGRVVARDVKRGLDGCVAQLEWAASGMIALSGTCGMAGVIWLCRLAGRPPRLQQFQVLDASLTAHTVAFSPCARALLYADPSQSFHEDESGQCMLHASTTVCVVRLASGIMATWTGAEVTRLSLAPASLQSALVDPRLYEALRGPRAAWLADASGLVLRGPKQKAGPRVDGCAGHVLYELRF